MTKEELLNAISIVSESHSLEIKINTPIDNFVGELGKKTFNLHVVSCPPIVVEKLLKEGYFCGMDHEGLSVNKW